MATFYARYPATIATASTTSTVQGPGTAGAQSGGVLTVQGDPAGTPIPVSGTITASNASIGATGATIPASATYVGGVNGGNLIGLNADSSGRIIQVGAGIAGTPAGGVVSVQGVASGTAVPISAASLPLPTGAATAALQPSLGTAGTASANVITVQGITSMTPLLVNGSGSTQPVSGTVTANAGTGTFAVSAATLPLPTGAATSALQPSLGTAGSASANVITVQGIASMTPLLVNGSASTQPISGTVTANAGSGTFAVSAASLPLPSGAATAALQPSLGTAGSASANVITVQGITSMTPLLVNGSGSTQPVSGTVAATQSGTWTVQPGNTANTTAWKVDGSAVTQPVSGTVTVGTVAPVTTTVAAFQAEGAVAFGSITASYVTLFTPTAATKMLQMRNNMNASVAVSMDAGSTTNYILDSGDTVSLDLLANALSMGATAIQVKYAVGAPTTGSFRINGVH